MIKTRLEGATFKSQVGTHSSQPVVRLLRRDGSNPVAVWLWWCVIYCLEVSSVERASGTSTQNTEEINKNIEFDTKQKTNEQGVFWLLTKDDSPWLMDGSCDNPIK